MEAIFFLILPAVCFKESIKSHVIMTDKSIDALEKKNMVAALHPRGIEICCNSANATHDFPEAT
jgi:hypothetical protein